MSTPEGRIKSYLKARLKETFGEGCYAFMPVQTGYGAATLDFLLCIGGRFIAIETKAPGKKTTPRQDDTISRIDAAGGISFIVDTKNHADACVTYIKALLEAAP